MESHVSESAVAGFVTMLMDRLSTLESAIDRMVTQTEKMAELEAKVTAISKGVTSLLEENMCTIPGSLLDMPYDVWVNEGERKYNHIVASVVKKNKTWHATLENHDTPEGSLSEDLNLRSTPHKFAKDYLFNASMTAHIPELLCVNDMEKSLDLLISRSEPWTSIQHVCLAMNDILGKMGMDPKDVEEVMLRSVPTPLVPVYKYAVAAKDHEDFNARVTQFVTLSENPEQLLSVLEEYTGDPWIEDEVIEAVLE